MENALNDRVVAVKHLTDWLEGNVELFRPLPGEGLNSFKHIKPLGECVLILYSFHAPGCETQDPQLLKWIASMTEKLFDIIETWGEDINWKELMVSVQSSPEISTPLLVFPVIEQLTGKSSRWMSNVRDCFSVTIKEHPSGQIDNLFARDLAGMADCHDQSVQLLNRTLAGEEAFYTSTLYLITHYLFFATKMGHREIQLPVEQLETLEKFLHVALKLASAKKNYDLNAELILCFHLLRFSPTVAYTDALKLLTGIIHTHGFVPGRHDGCVHNENDALEHYHSCLLTLAALGHPIKNL